MVLYEASGETGPNTLWYVALYGVGSALFFGALCGWLTTSYDFPFLVAVILGALIGSVYSNGLKAAHCRSRNLIVSSALLIGIFGFLVKEFVNYRMTYEYLVDKFMTEALKNDTSWDKAALRKVISTAMDKESIESTGYAGFVSRCHAFASTTFQF